MWEYIVMGQIPGTQIQVNFNTWVLIIAAPLCAWAIFMSVRSTTRTVHMVRHSQLFAMFRISYVMQTAAYMQLLATRRHIQA